MYGIQEILSHTEEQIRNVKRYMDKTGGFSYNDANIYMGLKRSVEKDVRESIRSISLKEFLISGLAGASNLVADKLADILYRAAQPMDIAALISADVINGWEGGDLTVDITDRYSLKARRSGSGGSASSRTPTTSQATLSPIAFNTPLIAESSMIEDSAYALVEWHVKQAAYAIAAMSNDLILNVLKTATDGVGTLNSALSGDADETKFTGGATSDLVTAIRRLGDDDWVPDTVVCTSEAWGNSIGVQAEPAGWTTYPSDRYNFTLGGYLDFLLVNSPELHLAADLRGAVMTNCITLIFNRSAALLTGRKRWMLIENFVNPMEDLEGAVVSSRQASVTLYNDSIFKITET